MTGDDVKQCTREKLEWIDKQPDRNVILARLKKGGFGPSENYAKKVIDIAVTLAALHGQWEGLPFGAAMAKLDAQRRFNTIALSLSVEEIAYRMRSTVNMLRANDIFIDYPDFARDLFVFRYDSDSVRLKWGCDFYRKDEKHGCDFYRKEKK